MPKSERQAAVDIPTLTRGEVAKRLGRDVSWVRRREGKELHPRFFDGAHQFDPHEVDALRAQLEAQKKEAEVSDAATEAIHQMFEMHAKAPRRFSVDGIAARTGASPQVVRSMHSNWLEGKEPSAPRLLTRRDLQAIETREERETEREHARQLAAWAREDDERAAARATEARARDEEYARREAARAEAQARRRHDLRTSRTTVPVRPASLDPTDLLASIALAGTIGAAFRSLLQKKIR